MVMRALMVLGRARARKKPRKKREDREAHERRLLDLSRKTRKHQPARGPAELVADVDAVKFNLIGP